MHAWSLQLTSIGTFQSSLEVDSLAHTEDKILQFVFDSMAGQEEVQSVGSSGEMIASLQLNGNLSFSRAYV